MNTEATNSLIDFDSFDPFSPTILTQNYFQDELNQTNPIKTESNVFAKDPFTDTFEDDNWQDKMHNINMKKIENSYGDSFGAFDASDNFGSNWNHEQTSSSNITDSQDLFQFEISRHDEVQRDDHAKTKEELKFVDKQVKLFHEDIQPTTTDDSNQIYKNMTKEEKVLLKCKNYFEEDEIIYPLDREVRPGTIKSAIDRDGSVGYYQDDVVNDRLVFVSGIDCKIELKEDHTTLKNKPKRDSLTKECLKNDSRDRVDSKSDLYLFYTESDAIDINTFIEKVVKKQMNEVYDEILNEMSSKEQNILIMKKDDKKQHNTTKPNGFKETEIVYNDTKINNAEEGDDIEEDRTRPMKGLAGLKAYDPNIEEEFSYSPPSRNDVTTSSAADKISSKIFNYGSSLENTCKQCNKKVYEMEKITVDFVIYHKSCFRCATCKRMLSPSTYSATDGQIYCKADFLKNFKMKGSYTFTPESSLPKENDEVDDDIRNYNGEETPVVPMKYMKNLFESNDVQADDKPGVWSNDRMDHNDHNDDNRAGVVVSSNVYVLEGELPPPSLARNLRTMFENKSTFKQQSNVTNKNNESSVAVTKSKVESPVINFEPEETNDVPQEGMTKGLLARWRDMEGSGREKTRGREEKRNIGAAQRSQSTTRLEISQRMKVVSNDRPYVSKSKEEGHNVRDLHQSYAPPRTFKWKVKEVTPLNRAGIVHGDIPKYQHVTGDIVNEKTPMSEINRDELLYNRPNFEEEYNKNIETKDDSPLKGSYVTEIKEEELPDHAAVKSAMMRFKSMEDPAREPPVPKTRTPSSRFSYYEPIPTTRLDDDDDDDDDDAADLKGLEELPAHGTTKKLMVKFQSK